MSLKIEKVLISDKVDASCKDVFDENNISCDYKPGISKDELKEIIKDYDALIVRSATKVTPDVLDCALRLKIVGRAGTGVDNIDLHAASRKGVLVMNTPGGNTMSAAEHTCAMISALARHIGQGYASLLEGKWERSKFMGCELNGKTLAIVGLGRIGREVASRMQSYGMKTIGFDPLVSKEEAATFGVDYLSLEEMWKIADFVTVHVPLIKPTEGMINSKVFSSCKKGMKVVNVARGGIIDEKDLLEALNSGNCGGAALDVFVTEPPKDISLELVKHPKVLCTPHLGASTIEAQLRVAKEISEQIVDAVNGKQIVGLVNAPALGDMGNPLYQPWVKLAEKLGVLVSTLHNTLKEVTIVHTGNALSSITRLLSAAVCFGMAKGLKLEANMINGYSLIKGKGIEVKSNTGECTVPSLSLVLDDGTKYSGLLTGDTPSLCQFRNIRLSNPVSMDTDLVVCNPTSLSAMDLLQKISTVNVQSISLGRQDNNCVVVGKISEVLEENVKEPFELIQL